MMIFEYKPAGKPLAQSEGLPDIDRMVQTELRGSRERGEYKKNDLTPEQCKDIADIQYGVSLIGVSGLGYDVEGACDGMWQQWYMGMDYSTKATDKSGGTLAWYPAFSEDDIVWRYDVQGVAGTGEENRYISLLTYHFLQEREFAAFSWIVENRNAFPQAGDVYASADGKRWTLIGAWDRNALRTEGEDYHFDDVTDADYGLVRSNCVALTFSLAGTKSSYLRFAFTSGNGRDADSGAYSSFSAAAGNAMSFRELAVYGYEKKQWGEAETLYNGIKLASGWLDGHLDASVGAATDIPYLIPAEAGGNRPKVIDITVGRQLFVDDFLIEETTLTQKYHSAEKYKGNPVMVPEGCGEGGPVLNSGGVWYDMDEKQFKMWYSPAFCRTLAYAVSSDGIHWEKPAINDDGSNLILREWNRLDKSAIWIDYKAPASERYKMMMRLPNNTGGQYPCYLFTSSDGIEWDRIKRDAPRVGDCTTFFYNPFRKKWILSARQNRGSTRVRGYAETDNFTDAWKGQKQFYWLNLDEKDPIDKEWNMPPHLYNFDAVAYESIMLGTCQILRGPENDVASMKRVPKITELLMSYSRDGFHFDRPDRTPFIRATRRIGDWDRGYLISSVGSAIIFDDEIWFYYSGQSGIVVSDSGEIVDRGMHLGGSIGIASLRRDGFASLDGSGIVLTRQLTVHGGKKYLFVNTDSVNGELKAEILDADGVPVPGYTVEECLGVRGDTTKALMRWKNGFNLSFLNDQNFRIRFYADNGRFYAFWLSRNEQGDSDGMTGGGIVNPDDYRTANPGVTGIHLKKEACAE